MDDMTIEEYRRRSREFEIEETRKGLIAYGLVVAAVVALLTVINLTLIREVIWFIYPAIGMCFGVVVHYLFGLRLANLWMRRRRRGLRSGAETCI